MDIDVPRHRVEIEQVTCKSLYFVLSLKAVLSKMHFLRVVVHAPGVAVSLTSTAVVKWSSLLVARSMVWLFLNILWPVSSQLGGQ